MTHDELIKAFFDWKHNPSYQHEDCDYETALRMIIREVTASEEAQLTEIKTALERCEKVLIQLQIDIEAILKGK